MPHICIYVYNHIFVLELSTPGFILRSEAPMANASAIFRPLYSANLWSIINVVIWLTFVYPIIKFQKLIFCLKNIRYIESLKCFSKILKTFELVFANLNEKYSENLINYIFRST